MHAQRYVTARNRWSRLKLVAGQGIGSILLTQCWANPYRKRPGEISRNDGGRGIYFEDPDGHFLEILTKPYGSGG